jgi:hypothetical protein
VEMTEGKRLLGRSRCRWMNNIKFELRKAVCGVICWIGLDEDRENLGGCCQNSDQPLGVHVMLGNS